MLRVVEEQAHLSREGLRRFGKNSMRLRRIEDLWRELHEAKLAEASDNTGAVMQNVAYSEGAMKSTLVQQLLPK